jgi:hypothetical protein
LASVRCAKSADASIASKALIASSISPRLFSAIARP